MDGKDLMRCLFHTNLKQAVKMLTHQLVRLGETKEMARSGNGPSSETSNHLITQVATQAPTSVSLRHRSLPLPKDQWVKRL